MARVEDGISLQDLLGPQPAAVEDIEAGPLRRASTRVRRAFKLTSHHVHQALGVTMASLRGIADFLFPADLDFVPAVGATSAYCPHMLEHATPA
mmetsp:Transcript_379/g.608  ORF Transcript_379/g.608 Transcript_379/m.608 type:complete len:94 (-) Transcript_379:62-343(-)